MMNLPFLNNEVLMCVFEHLDVDSIKSCRLACQQWCNFSFHNSIADQYQLTFRSHVHTTDEMNLFLIGTERVQLDVEFIGVQLKELNFKVFGAKLKNLVITNCFVDNEATIKDILMYTPNLKRLSFSIIADTGTSEIILHRAFDGLQQERFSNANLESFKCCTLCNFLDPIELSRMFPRLRQFAPQRIVVAGETLASFMLLQPLSIWTTLTELATNVYLRSNTTWVSACLQFFSNLVHLKSVKVNLWFYSHDEFEDAYKLVSDFYKAILCFLLKNCHELSWISLRALGFTASGPFLVNKSCIQLQIDEYPQFLRSISNVERLDTSGIIVDNVNAFRKALTLYGSGIVKSLKSLILSRTLDNALDLRLVLLEECPNFETLDLCIEVLRLNLANLEGDSVFSRPINLADVIHSKKKLLILRLVITASRAELSAVDELYLRFTRGPMIRHRKLKRLDLHFTSLSIRHICSLNSFFGTSWNFPNLQILQMSMMEPGWQTQEMMAKFRKKILVWIKMMPVGMHRIIFPLRKCVCMSIEEITTICKAQTELKQIAWASMGYPDASKVIDLFDQHCRMLCVVSVYVYGFNENDEAMYEAIEYHYSKSQQRLYKSIRRKGRPTSFILV